MFAHLKGKKYLRGTISQGSNLICLDVIEINSTKGCFDFISFYHWQTHHTPICKAGDFAGTEQHNLIWVAKAQTESRYYYKLAFVWWQFWKWDEWEQGQNIIIITSRKSFRVLHSLCYFLVIANLIFSTLFIFNLINTSVFIEKVPLQAKHSSPLLACLWWNIYSHSFFVPFPLFNDFGCFWTKLRFI